MRTSFQRRAAAAAFLVLLGGVAAGCGDRDRDWIGPPALELEVTEVSAMGGEQVTLRLSPAPGQRVLEEAQVRLDAEPVASSALSDDTLVFTPPPNPAGNVSDDLLVTLQLGGSTLEAGTLKRAAAAPKVTIVAPGDGSHRGGTALVITGAGFVPGCSVSVGGVAATDVVVVSATELTCTSPAGVVGARDVAVVHPEGPVGQAGQAFSYTNARPVAGSVQVTLAEDGSVLVTLLAKDKDGDPLTYDVGTPAHGVLSGTAPTLTYTPAADWNGADAFSFTASDGLEASDAAQVELVVQAVNDAPLALAQTPDTDEDTPRAITLQGADVDGDALTYHVGAPAKGVLAGTPPNLTYTPAADWSGEDGFSFSVSDGTTTSAPATVKIGVKPVNDAPVASVQVTSTAEDGAKTITLVGSDVEGSALTYTIITQPAHGALSGTPPEVTYTPGADWSGADSFSFTVSDGALTSAPAAVAVVVTPVNDAPVAKAGSSTTAEDTPRELNLAATDVDGDALTYTLVTPPAHGTVTIAGSSATYTPGANYAGADSFEFKASDGALSSTAAVSITVTAVNDAPVAGAQAASTAEDTAKAITLAGSDVEGSALTYAIATPPAHGTLSGTPPDVTYTPEADWTGTDEFAFTVNDGALTSSAATVSITVTPVNDAPVAKAGSSTTAEDAAKELTLEATDVDGDALTYTLVTPPAHGTVAIVGSAATYTPGANYAGADSFEFKASDGALSSTAIVSLTVTAVDDAPAASAQATSTAEDTAKAITLSGSDVEGSALTYAIVTQPAHGALSGTPPEVTYTPAADWAGVDSFTFTVSDGALTSTPATVWIAVASVNDAPVASAQAVSTAEDTPKELTLVATDVDGDHFDYAIVTGPTHGTLSGAPPTLTYTPGTNWSGADSFTFVVYDDQEVSAPATVSITVSAVNDAPVATAQTVLVAPDTAKTITLAGTDVEGSGLTFTITSQPSHGTLSGTPPGVTYTPTSGYHGADSFTFTASDGELTSAPATVSITVQTPAPVVTSVSPTSGPNSGGTSITITGSNFDWEAAVYLDGVPCSDVAVVTPTYLVCVTPAGFVGAAELKVVNPGGASGAKADAFTYLGIDPSESLEDPSAPGVTQDYPAVAFEGGVLHVAWAAGSGPRDVCYRRSADGGYTWSAPVLIAGRSGDEIYSVIAASGDDVVIAWQDLTDGHRDIWARHSADAGLTWGAPVLINTDGTTTSQYQPSVAMDGDLVVVSWHSAEVTPRQAFTRRSTDGGATWQPVVRVLDDLEGAGATNVAVDGQVVLVCWEIPGGAGVGFARSADGGASFGPFQYLDASGGATPAVSIDGSTAVVTWGLMASSSVLVRVSTDAGLTWGYTQVLTAPDGSTAPDVSVRGQEVLLVYSNWSTGGSFVRRSADGGASWASAQRVDSGDSREITVDHDGASTTFALVYTDTNRLYVRLGDFGQ